MAENGHVPHDSGLSVGSSREEDAAKIKDLEEEVRVLAERANAACRRCYKWRVRGCCADGVL